MLLPVCRLQRPTCRRLARGQLFLLFSAEASKRTAVNLSATPGALLGRQEQQGVDDSPRLETNEQEPGARTGVGQEEGGEGAEDQGTYVTRRRVLVVVAVKMNANNARRTPRGATAGQRRAAAGGGGSGSGDRSGGGGAGRGSSSSAPTAGDSTLDVSSVLTELEAGQWEISLANIRFTEHCRQRSPAAVEDIVTKVREVGWMPTAPAQVMLPDLDDGVTTTDELAAKLTAYVLDGNHRLMAAKEVYKDDPTKNIKCSCYRDITCPFTKNIISDGKIVCM